RRRPARSTTRGRADHRADPGRLVRLRLVDAGVRSARRVPGRAGLLVGRRRRGRPVRPRVVARGRTVLLPVAGATMNFMQNVSSGAALAVGTAATVPSVVYAAI